MLHPSTVLRPFALVLVLLAAGCSDPESPPSAPAQAGPAGQPEPTAPAAKPGAPAKTSNSAMLALQQGRSLLLRGDPKRAEGEFQRAVELDPALAEGHFELGKLRLHLSSQNVGSNARDQEVLERGLASMARALELDPKNDQYAYWLGRGHHLAKHNEEARKYLEQAIALNGENADAYKRLGMVYVDLEQLEPARQAFQKALEHDPKEAGAAMQLGQVELLFGDPAAARAAFERSMAIDPTQPEPYGALAKLLAQQGDDAGASEFEAKHKTWTEFDERLQKCRVAVNKAPDDAVALRRLAKTYLSVDKRDDALEWFLKAVHIDPKDAQSHMYCGILLRERGELEMATHHLKEAEFLDPDHLDPKLELLRLYVATKDDAAFQALLATVEGEASGDGASLQALGEVCHELGRAEDAERLLGKARALGVVPGAEGEGSTEDR